jgi:hypothetical protein
MLPLLGTCRLLGDVGTGMWLGNTSVLGRDWRLYPTTYADLEPIVLIAWRW